MTGLRLGVFVVQAPLGAGGMGVVYRALDTNLNRPVAIKFLSDELANPTARRRFQREAQTASSLNHPHIVTVHDAGEFEGRQYLVTELVDGGTLRDWARGAKRGWRQTVELLTGIADGLATAHDAGILHRDIKPENILMTKSGYAKLGDFGLAKLLEGETSAQTPTVSDLHTRAGIIVGTAAYMSPEQASGEPLDARSDVFSFGVVLYEALAGRRPFIGTSNLDIAHAVVHRAAEPLPEDVPLPLRIIVEKALEKDPADRFQTMRDMVVDLRRVARQSVAATPGLADMPRPTRGRLWLATVAALVVVLSAAGALIVSRFLQPAEPARREYTQLTNFADSATDPALSPDGRMLTFIRGVSLNASFGPGQVYVKLLPDGEPVQLTRDNVFKGNPKFSPDGTRIGYMILAEDGKTLDTWIVPVLGGQPRLFLTNASALTWTRERNTVAASTPSVLFSEFTGRGFQMSIVSSTESRARQRTVYMPPETGMAHRSSLSPDGTHVLVIEMGNGEKGGYGWLPCRLAPFDSSSSGKPVGPAPAQCTDAAWSPDGEWMFFSTNTGNGSHIWRQRVPDGTPEQVTFGVTEEEGIHFDPDGRSFVTSIGSRQSTVWIHDSRGDRQITSEGFAFFPTVSPDGKNLYYLARDGGTRNFLTGGLWVADLESGQRRRLLPDFQVRHYTISADGQRVVFVAADEAGRTPVWLAALNGGSAPRRLTTMDGFAAYFGAPGEVVFDSEENGANFVHRIKDDGSELQKLLTTPNLSVFAVSPDGQWVSAETPTQFGATMMYPAGGDPPTLICGGCNPPQGTEMVPARLSWTPDGRFLYLILAGSTFAIPLKPGQMLPPIPAGGFQSKEAVAALPGARLISQESVFPGPNPSIYAFMKVSTHRNIYRVPVP
ncbi:MAG: protein kinase [Vicinamibacterales bacterium]